MARQLFDWQRAKEIEVCAGDFAKAAEFLDRQASMLRLLLEMVEQIAKDR
jgi:hypothetical protein